MSESFPSSSNNPDHTAETDLFTWLTLHQEASASEREINHSMLLSGLAQLHQDKSAITNSLGNISVSPPGSNHHEIGVGIIDSRTEAIPQTLSHCLNYYFAISPDLADRLSFTKELIDNFSREALNQANIPLEYAEPPTPIDLSRLYEEKQLDPAFIMAVQEHMEAELGIFADSVAEHYDF